MNAGNFSHFSQFRLTVRVPQIGKPKQSEYVAGDLLAASARHAITLYWENCKHVCPTMLDLEGYPVGTRPLKRRELIARPLPPGSPPPPSNVRPEVDPPVLPPQVSFSPLAAAVRKTLFENP